MSPPQNPTKAQIEFYEQRISELTMEQLRLFPFAFEQLNTPSDVFMKDSYYLYWEHEESIQNCKDELIKLKGILV